MKPRPLPRKRTHRITAYRMAECWFIECDQADFAATALTEDEADAAAMSHLRGSRRVES